MDLDGSNKHRISPLPGCASLWLEEAGVGVLLPGPMDAPVAVRLSPTNNLLADWIAEPLRFIDGLIPGIPEFQGDLPQFDGRYAILPGEVAPGDIRLFIVDPVADTVRLLTPDPGWHKEPVWDPDAREVIYSSNRGGTISLWAVDPFNPDAPHVQLTDSPTQDERSAVRNGRILFVRGFGVGETEGDYEIRMLDRRTGVEEVLVSRPWNDFMARWSPDGRHICWTSTEFGHFESDIWVMNVATRKMRNLTRNLVGRNYECRWGPDSRTVIFSSTGDGRAQIYRALRNGRFLENISRSEAEAEPSWVLPRSVIDRFAP
jgi:Tol biopolymer transport system component